MKDKISEVIRKFARSRGFNIILFAIMGLLAAASLYAGIRNAYTYSQDFQYDAAKALAMGYDPYDYSLKGEISPDIPGLEDFYGYYESIDAPQRMEANQFPSLLYLLLPYTFFDASLARLLWLLSNLIFTVVIILLLKATFMKETDGKLFAVFSLLMIAGTPWRNQIGVGQHTLFSLAFFLLAVYLSVEKERPWAAGLALCISYFKYTVTVPLAVYLIYKRKWKELIISIPLHIAGTAAAALILKESFFDMLIKPLRVASALSGEGSMDIGALIGGGIPSLLVTVLLMIFLLVTALYCPEGNDSLVISLCVLLSLIMTYHRLYDYFVLIIVFAYFDVNRKGYAGIYYLITCFAVFFLPRLFHEAGPAMVFTALLYYIFTVYMMITAVRTVKGGSDG